MKLSLRKVYSLDQLLLLSAVQPDVISLKCLFTFISHLTTFCEKTFSLGFIFLLQEWKLALYNFENIIDMSLCQI